MTITAQHIRDTLTDYLNIHLQDSSSLEPAFDLLDAGVDLDVRRGFRGHATAGAILADDSGRRVLHVHHRALDRWLLPGGHLEETDETLIEAAIRELTEETGIPAGAIVTADLRPLHIDVHPIPANDARGEPQHQHVDFRFLFHTSNDVIELQTEEVIATAWRHVDTACDQGLRTRLRETLQ